MKVQASLFESPLACSLGMSPLESALRGGQDSPSDYYVGVTEIPGFANPEIVMTGGGLFWQNMPSLSNNLRYSTGRIVGVTPNEDGDPAVWTTSYPDNYAFGFPAMIVDGTYRGIYTSQHLVLGGRTDVVKGTVSRHAPASATTFHPAYASEYHAGGNVVYENYNESLCIIFWLGKTPDQLPTADFNPADFSLGKYGRAAI